MSNTASSDATLQDAGSAEGKIHGIKVLDPEFAGSTISSTPEAKSEDTGPVRTLKGAKVCNSRISSYLVSANI